MEYLGSSSSRILVIGGTGMIGQHLVKASLAAGHPTAVLVRRPAADADPSKLKLMEVIKASGATIVYGDLYEHESLVSALKQADAVISAVGHHGPHDLEDGQLRIVAAIKEAGNVKRFLPSEYGCDVEQAARSSAVVEPARSILEAKARVRQAVRAAGIPFTFVCSYWAHGFVLPRLGDPHVDGPPETNKVTVFGDDGTRVIFVDEADMSAVAIRAVDDPRALNKVLYLRPPANTCSFSHLVRLWEEKTFSGRALLEKRYVAEEELLRMIGDSPPPLDFQLAMVHATVAGAACCDQAVDASTGVDATELYPDFNYVTVNDYMEGLAAAQQQQLNNETEGPPCHTSHQLIDRRS